MALPEILGKGCEALSSTRYLPAEKYKQSMFWQLETEYNIFLNMMNAALEKHIAAHSENYHH